MKCRMLLIAIILVLAVDAEAQSQDRLEMTCRIPRTGRAGLYRLVRPSSVTESERLAAAPHGAKRVGKHELDVAWTSGTHKFADEPPYDEPFDGVWWAYCGYDSTVGLHLLMKQDKSLFTGALLDDRSGNVLPGGEVVLFSPDRKSYLAYEQPDGQDGETIRLYGRTGNLIWEGYNGILTPDRKTVVAEFRNMRWDAQNRLQADAHVGRTKIVTVTLTEREGGKREWLPHVEENMQ